MNESELIQAWNGSIALAYTASQWWVTASFALVVSMHFAAKHIPRGLFYTIVVLYLATALSSIYELASYAALSGYYGERLSEYRAAHHIAYEIRENSVFTIFNGLVNYVVLILASVAAVAYSFVAWRAARRIST